MIKIVNCKTKNFKERKKKLVRIEGIKTFKTVKLNRLNLPQKSVVLRKQLRLRHLFNLTLQRRLFMTHLSKKKKKVYKLCRDIVGKKRESFKKLLRIYSRNFARYVRKRKKFKKFFKRILRRQKRKKKWRRRGIFRLFRSRYCFKHKFYIPRHFEINYKTGNMLYLGFNDANSYNFRLPFPLNIRKLATVMSS